MEQDTDMAELCAENPFMMGCGLSKDQDDKGDGSFGDTVSRLWGHVKGFFGGGDEATETQTEGDGSAHSGMY
jgi:hypothetical protein